MEPFDRNHFAYAHGLILKNFRNEVGMTQKEFADILELSRAAYTNMEYGQTRITTDIVWRLALNFNVPIRELFPEPQNGRLL